MALCNNILFQELQKYFTSKINVQIKQLEIIIYTEEVKKIK